MDKLVIKNLSKAFGKAGVLHSVSFTVKDGEFLSILGPSGCGKTTILRLLIGLENADSGEIIKDGIDITHFPPSRRKMGIVLLCLPPHFAVLIGLNFGLYLVFIR